MATITLGDPSRTVDVVKEAFWLAWQACGGTAGSGFIQDRPQADRELVWKGATSQSDYPGGPARGAEALRCGEVYGDYVFGRMMKMRMKFNAAAGTIEISDSTPRSDYQAWCRKYPTHAALLEAAMASLGVTAAEPTPA